MTFLELAEKILLESSEPLSSVRIWEMAVEKGYDIFLNTKGKTPGATLGAQIHVNAKDHPNTRFGVVGSRPKYFYLKQLKNKYDLGKYERGETLQAEEVKITEKSNLNKKNYLEKDLHSYLSYFAYYFLRSYTKTINHSTSNKKDFGEWVHPDIVGCYFPIEEWQREVFELSSAVGSISVKLLSFELKRQLSFSNLRESFFQAVSNSSWANEGYLVAAEISEDEDFRNELRRLSSSFGIGVIELDISDPNSSKVIFPSRFNESVDWEMVNKLTMNRDFEEFIKRVKTDISSREIRKEKYDAIIEEGKLIRSI